MDKYDIVVVVTSYNTLSTRESGLIKCLNGIRLAYSRFKEKYPDKSVCISWIDDASTDLTVAYVDKYFSELALEIPYVMTRLGSNSHQGYCRNLGAKVVDSDFIMFCDSDDAYLDNHIINCYEAIQTKDSADRYVAMATANILTNRKLGIHPHWKPRIASTIPITKIIHRLAFDFIEGFPCHEIHKVIGCEDQDFVNIVNYFFNIIQIQEPSVEYCNYPGSFFDRQLPKFRVHPKKAPDNKEHYDLHKVRELLLQERFNYLKYKLTLTPEWYTKLRSLSVKYL